MGALAAGLGPSSFAAGSSDLGAEIREGLLETGTPSPGPNFCSLARSEEQLAHVHVEDDLAVCMAVVYPRQHPSLLPSPIPPPVPLAPLPCSKLWRLSWASWCSCSMPGGRPAARKTFTGCCHDSLVWAAFLLSRSRLEVAVGEREQSEREAGGRLPFKGCRGLPADATPAQHAHPVLGLSRNAGSGMWLCPTLAKPPRQAAAGWDQTPSPAPLLLQGLDTVPTGCQNKPGRAQGEIGEGSKPCCPG